MTVIAQIKGPHRTAKVAIGLAVDLACRVNGRRNVLHAVRWAYRRVHPDFGYDMRLNGEFALQGWILDHLPRGQLTHVIDVGANVGEWSKSLLETAERCGRMDEIDLHAFEPAADTFEMLRKTLDNPAVSLQRVALSDRIGEMTLHIATTNSEWNSFHYEPGRHDDIEGEDVATTTLDAYVQQAGLSRVDLLKIDAEGHDLAVLKGASGLLREGRIAVVQFEYNDSWIYARHYLRDAFRLLEPLGYRLGQLTPLGVEFYPSWNSGLETFWPPIYVACRKDAAGWLPRVEWRSVE